MLAGPQSLWMPRKGSVSCLSHTLRGHPPSLTCSPHFRHRQSHKYCIFQTIFHNLLSYSPWSGRVLQSEDVCDWFGPPWMTRYNIPHLSICDSRPSRKRHFLDRGAYSQVLGVRSWTSALSSTLGRKPGQIGPDQKTFTHHALR